MEISPEEAKTLRWACKYVAQELGDTHRKKLLQDENLTETGFGERAERLLSVAHRIEEEFELTPFD